ncbi:hypothetical protein SE16_13670 [Ardenticatena maritima]|uniref:Branched-chain amino acid ABC transporter permease n=1 Tax=Ardenticatena maritima TaxID=872965 RepID=A0A0P6Y9G5_9CHLR|nr:hypothetical protein SE16_13670 [Ardenticatena maritima]
MVLLLVVANGMRSANVKQWVTLIQSGLYLASITFLVASGFSLIFGLMDVLNFAHGTILMFGAYAGYTVFANPRLFLNTMPLVVVMFGVAWAVGMGAAWRATGWRRWLALAALGLFLWLGWRHIPLEALRAFAGTSVGGAVPTAEAQEPLGRMLMRVLWLVAAGATLGVLLPPLHVRAGVRRRVWLALGVLLGAAVMVLPARTALEQGILALPTDVRFVIALLVGAGTGAVLGALLEWGLIRPLYARPIYQILLTLGLVFVGAELVKLVWGQAAYPPMPAPSLFAERCTSASFAAWLSEHCSAVKVLGRNVPTYRLFVVGIALATFLAVGLLLQRTRLGLIIRAGVEDDSMVQALGIDVRRVFTLVFALGSALAALGGVVLAPVEGLDPGMGFRFLLAAVIAVVIGGMGRYSGAALGALLVGLGRAMFDFWGAVGYPLPGGHTWYFSPTVAEASTVIIMAIVLLIRPSGLLGESDE